MCGNEPFCEPASTTNYSAWGVPMLTMVKPASLASSTLKTFRPSTMRLADITAPSSANSGERNSDHSVISTSTSTPRAASKGTSHTVTPSAEDGGIVATGSYART